MKDFPSCFGENGVQIADSSPTTTTTNTTTPQNLITNVYHYHSQAFSGFITITWIKYLIAQGLTIGIENSTKVNIGKVDIKPWLFSKRKGFKNLVINSTTVDIYWDLSSAKFGSTPEPLEQFYLAIAINQELCLLLGDLQSRAYNKIDSSPSKATLVARKEHIFGKRLYSTKAQFCGKGRLHDIRIEYDSSERFGKCLIIYIDSKKVLEVMYLKWKFRGNQSILVDGVSVEVYWDVYSWLFGSVLGNAIFLFRTHVPGEMPRLDWSPLEPSELRWKAWEMTRNYTPSQGGLGFSLILCAWKNE